mmetsp:Transcript_76646/g.144408  ORF Transcript_76646/g.144408 Transcript_76646/m.144408 type:complete len:398 (+) Transcript_76646:19-1212(+)
MALDSQTIARLQKLEHAVQQVGFTYSDRNRLHSDVQTLLRDVRTLHPHHGTFSAGGRTLTLFYLYGVVPISYKGNPYNIPVTIYFDPPYPRSAPRCFVTPSQNMMLKSGHRNVDQGGMIHLPCLSNWDDSSNLPDLVANIASIFSFEPPVHSTSATPRQQHTYAATQSLQTTSAYPATRAQAMPVVQAHSIAPNRHTEKARELEKKAKEVWNKEIKAIVDDTNQQLARLAKLEEQSEKADAEIVRLQSAAAAHKEREAELAAMEQSLQNFVKENRGKTPDPDSFTDNLDGDSEQVLNLLAEELACEDFLVALDELLTAGKISMEDFLRETRNVSRDQFMLKAKRTKAAAAVAQAAGVPVPAAAAPVAPAALVAPAAPVVATVQAVAAPQPARVAALA